VVCAFGLVQQNKESKKLQQNATKLVEITPTTQDDELRFEGTPMSFTTCQKNNNGA